MTRFGFRRLTQVVGATIIVDTLSGILRECVSPDEMLAELEVW